MPSDTGSSFSKTVTGRCYCGAQNLSGAAPQTVAYCHCSDCRRVTGAAFAAFAEAEVSFEPALGDGVSFASGVQRWFCAKCGSPIAATYDYLPGQVYVPLGLIDQASDLPPALHAHAGSKLPWLHISDDLPREDASSRARLQAARP